MIPFVVFPKLDTRTIEARITFPDGTPGEVTDRATQKIEQALQEVAEQLGGDLVKNRFRMAGWTTYPNDASAIGGSFNGGHLGSGERRVGRAGGTRDVHSERLIELWRQRWNEQYASRVPRYRNHLVCRRGDGAGRHSRSSSNCSPPPTKRVSLDWKKPVELCKAKLAEEPGVVDIEDDSRPGKWEYQIRVKEEAKALGVTAADLAETVRAAYYGEEVMRLQRGRHEVKLMVRYPPEQRRSLADFQNIRVRTAATATERPITELADIQVSRGYSEINRRDQLRAITISADVQGDTNAREVVARLPQGFLNELLARRAISRTSACSGKENRRRRVNRSTV